MIVPLIGPVLGLRGPSSSARSAGRSGVVPPLSDGVDMADLSSLEALASVLCSFQRGRYPPTGSEPLHWRLRASVPPADRVCRRHSLPNSLGMLLCERMPRLQCCFRPLPRIYSPNYWTKMLRVPSAGNIQISILSSDSY